jgi:3',5'-nucleoside bisphosphate phosphatase
MAEPARFIDLHSHSLASDGQYPAAQVAEQAAAGGVAVWALTDHDTLAGLEPAAAAARHHGLRFVPGIELSCFLDGQEIHVLGHFVDPTHPALKRFEDLLAVNRRERMGKIIALLAGLGIRVTEADIEKYSGGKTLGRPHVARALVDLGAVSTVREAFDLYLAEGKPAFVQRYRMQAPEAVELIRNGGGVATLAHPGVSRMERGHLMRLRDMGLGGVEVHHSDHNPSVREKYLRIAEELDLVPTAGSDYHGEAVAPDRKLGSVDMGETAFARLEARRR